MSLYKTTEGKLLIKSGSLMTDCCCSDCSEDVSCDSCSPNLCDEYTVAFSGLVGDLAPYNGAHTVTYTSGCFWVTFLDPAPVYSEIRLYTVSSLWVVGIIHIFTGCHKTWLLAGSGCDPIAVYGSSTCVDFNCSGMCAANTGGIATVS